MANTIITKNSSTASAVPTSGDLVQGELAVNVTDKRLFTEDSGGNVVEVGTNPSTMAVAGNATVGGTLGVTGATTLAGASVTSLTNSGATTLSSGTANAVTYLNGSKVLTSGSALVFDGSNFGVAAGNINLGNAYFLNGRNTANTGYVPIVKVAAGDILEFGSGGYNAHFTGSLGIGTSSPAAKFEIYSTNNTFNALQVRYNGSNDEMGFGIANANGYPYIGYNTKPQAASDIPVYERTNAAAQLRMDGGAFKFLTAPSGTAGNAISFTQAMTLDATGRLVLGATTATEKFTLYGGMYIGDSASSINYNALVLDYNTTSHEGRIAVGGVSGASSSLTFVTANAGVEGERARIDSSGNLLVGTTSGAAGNRRAMAFDVTNGRTVWNHNTSNVSGDYYHMFYYSTTLIGSITQSGTTAVAYNTSSDYRLKNTIAPITGALAKVALLKPCTYKWNADGSDGEGFIAHELAEVCPQAVTGEKDAVDADGNPVYQGIDTSFLAGLYAAALQELMAEVNSLKAEIAALKA